MFIISPAQCRAARALLNWSQPDLAEKCDMHVQTISNFENETSTPSKTTIQKIESVITSNGILLTEDDGIKRISSKIKEYKGREGFRAFMNDIYDTMSPKGGEMCLLNADPDLWIKHLGEEWYNEVHVPRMTPIKDKIKGQITVLEGKYNFIARNWAEYRWLPKSIWHQNSFYSFNDKIGFLNFDNDDIEIHVLHHKKFAETYRFLFNLVWDQYSIIPDVPDHKPQDK
jgi:transcriptional regulator with XRE-family HTH domain